MKTLLALVAIAALSTPALAAPGQLPLPRNRTKSVPCRFYVDGVLKDRKCFLSTEGENDNIYADGNDNGCVVNFSRTSATAALWNFRNSCTTPRQPDGTFDLPQRPVGRDGSCYIGYRFRICL